MILIAAKTGVLIFGLFLIGVGLLMFIKPGKALEYLSKAGSTNLINYLEITIRMLPAFCLVIYAPYSRYPIPFSTLGWFMIGTSLVLYAIPRRFHHKYALFWAERFKTTHVRILAPLSILFGSWIISGILSY